MTLSETVDLLRANGFRLRRIAPADSPRVAQLDDPEGVSVTLSSGPELRAPGPPPPAGTVEVGPAEADADPGRAGMRYLDLVPSRLSGHVIASLISVPEGGPVPDYVHHHRIGFQLIHCRRGWVDVLYQDQGEMIRMHEGDALLQPPGIRHRVVEASPGLEVFEVGSPAEHDTLTDPDCELPTGSSPDRVYGAGQRFAWHRLATAEWLPAGDGWSVADSGIGAASNDAGRVVTLRGSGVVVRSVDHGRVGLWLVDRGTVRIDGEEHAEGALVSVVGGVDVRLESVAEASVFEVDLALGLEPAGV